MTEPVSRPTAVPRAGLYEGAYGLHGYAVKINRVHNKAVKGRRDRWTVLDFREAWLDK